MAANTSATGGPLLSVPPPPLTGAALTKFLQGWVVGICGLDGKLVRPRWQTEPPNIPDAGDAWAAIGITAKQGQTFPYVGFDDNAYQLQNHEDFSLLCSFYDTGVDGLADDYATAFRDGLAIDQNLELLLTEGMGFVSVDGPTPIPVLVKTRWLYRTDVAVGLRREIVRTYPVLDIVAADVRLYTDVGTPPIERTITVDNPDE